MAGPVVRTPFAEQTACHVQPCQKMVNKFNRLIFLVKIYQSLHEDTARPPGARIQNQETELMNRPISLSVADVPIFGRFCMKLTLLARELVRLVVASLTPVPPYGSSVSRAARSIVS